MKKCFLTLSVTVIIFSFVPHPLSALTCAELEGSYVYSQETNPVYLGFFGSQFALESIMNAFGTYGSPYNSLSVRNEFGTYGSPYNVYSANNEYTSTPPEIYRNGVLMGYLTSNTLFLNGVSLAVIDASCNFYSTLPQTSTQPPSAPSWVNASDGIFTDIIQVSWSAVSGAIIYNVYYSETLTGPKNYIDSSYDTSLAIVGSVPGQLYYFWVTANNAAWEGSHGGPDSGYAGSLQPTTLGLSIYRSGNGSGTIISSPAGINCGSDCQENYVNNTVVDLIANPDADSLFSGWSGACTGAGSCQITMDSAKSVTATFNLYNKEHNKGLPWLMLLLDD